MDFRKVERCIQFVIYITLNNSEAEKAVTVAFAAFRNSLLETFVPTLVFPTCPSLQILGKTQTGVFPNSGFLVKYLIKENCHNSRAFDDIDMKLGPVTKKQSNVKKF